MNLFIDLHRKSAKEARRYFTSLLMMLCILKLLFGDNLSINIPILKYVILRQAEKYKYFGYKYKLNKKTANGSMIITF